MIRAITLATLTAITAAALVVLAIVSVYTLTQQQEPDDDTPERPHPMIANGHHQ